MKLLINSNKEKVFSRTTHEEYWIPAEDLEEFNLNITGKIKIIAEFRRSDET